MSDRPASPMPAVDGVAGGRAPLKPGQIISLVALALVALSIVYYMFQASTASRKAPAVEVQHTDNERAAPFQGAPAPASPQPAAAPKPMPATVTASAEGGETPDQKALAAPIVAMNGARAAQARPVTSAEDGAIRSRSREETPLEASLHTSILQPVHAKVIADPTHTILPGTLIPCTQATKIDTSNGGPSLVQATIPQDVWGANHKVILIDRGSTVVGEIGHGLVNGLDRLGVAWSVLYGPGGAYEVSLDSPAAGPLGEAGLDGDVNRHEWQKLKGVLLLSLLNGGMNIAASAVGHGSGNSLNLYQFQSSGQEVANTLLGSTITIPDTLTRDQGLACSIFVARKLVFSDVWKEQPVR